MCFHWFFFLCVTFLEWAVGGFFWTKEKERRKKDILDNLDTHQDMFYFVLLWILKTALCSTFLYSWLIRHLRQGKFTFRREEASKPQKRYTVECNPLEVKFQLRTFKLEKWRQHFRICFCWFYRHMYSKRRKNTDPLWLVVMLISCLDTCLCSNRQQKKDKMTLMSLEKGVKLTNLLQQTGNSNVTRVKLFDKMHSFTQEFDLQSCHVYTFPSSKNIFPSLWHRSD